MLTLKHLVEMINFTVVKHLKRMLQKIPSDRVEIKI